MYLKHEISKKMRKLFPYYKDSVFKPSFFDKKLMRNHIIYYYAQDQLLRGEKIFDFSSNAEHTSSVSENNSNDLNHILKSINQTQNLHYSSPKKYQPQLRNNFFKKNEDFQKKYFEIDVSEIQNIKAKSILNNKEILRDENNSEENESFDSRQILATPSSRKEIPFRKGIYFM